MTLATRTQTFGNPLLGFNEQFYLLVGDRMAHGGVLPFIDIFDRKPRGLFLTDAATRLLGGEGTLHYQFVAVVFAFATALVIAGVARRFAGGAGALARAIAYLVWLALLSGEGGRAPVFYNLPVLLAAAATMRLVGRDDAPSIGAGALPMLLVGLAMQIKYTALFEGMYLGLALLVAGHRAGQSTGRSIVIAAAWIAVTLAPTFVAWADYVAIGHGGEFVFANFVSHWGRLSDRLATGALGLFRIAGILAPLLDCAALPPAEARASRELRFIQMWLAAAIGGVLVMHRFPSPHYGLPLLAPAAIAAAPRLGGSGARGG